MRIFGGPKRSKGDLPLIEAIGDHIEKHIGKISLVLDEIRSPHAHIDVYLVNATTERPYHVIMTSGMAEQAMPVPEGAEDGMYAELLLCLPPEWPLKMEAFDREENWWPIRLLKGIARYPYEQQTWLYAGHTVPGSEPPVSFAATTLMTDVLLLTPKLVTGAMLPVRVKDGRHVKIWGLFPIYREERDFARSRGSTELEHLFNEQGVTELLVQDRANCCGQFVATN